MIAALHLCIATQHTIKRCRIAALHQWISLRCCHSATPEAPAEVHNEAQQQQVHNDSAAVKWVGGRASGDEILVDYDYDLATASRGGFFKQPISELAAQRAD